MTPKLYEKNSKKHPDKQLKQIASSLKEFGWRQPIVTDKDDVIIVGHGRWLAYKKYPEGIKEPWIVKADDLTDEQVKAYRLADNKLNESEWDMGLAIEELKELSPEMFDLTGFDKDLLIEPDEKDDVIPENVEPIAKLGDIWQLGRHRVMCGDSTQPEAVLRLMEGKKADMVFTDPPYGVDYEGINNDDDCKEFENSLEGEYTKSGGAIYICSPDKNLGEFIKIFDTKFRRSQTIIWEKDTLVLGRGDYSYQHEAILYGWNKGTHKFIGKKGQSTVWKAIRPKRAEGHPTSKPVELIDRAIMNSTKEEDIIIDLFLGSGSTLIACEKTNRICYGMEIDPKYVDVIIKRYEDYSGNNAIKL